MTLRHDDRNAIEVPLIGGRSTVTRKGAVVFRQSAPWSPTTIGLLRHLQSEGFEYAPRVVGDGFDDQGREMLTFVEGESPHPYPWQEEALPRVGVILRDLHRAAKTFAPKVEATWRPWFGRQLGRPSTIGHCDTGAWNILARDGMPVALIDWEEAGPVDPLIELAQACWLNALLFDDDLAEKLGLGNVETRGVHVRLILDGYELPRSARIGFMGLVRDFAVLNAANEVSSNLAQRETNPSGLLDAVSWRARSAAWIVKNFETLDRIVL